MKKKSSSIQEKSPDILLQRAVRLRDWSFVPLAIIWLVGVLVMFVVILFRPLIVLLLDHLLPGHPEVSVLSLFVLATIAVLFSMLVIDSNNKRVWRLEEIRNAKKAPN